MLLKIVTKHLGIIEFLKNLYKADVRNDKDSGLYYCEILSPVSCHELYEQLDKISTRKQGYKVIWQVRRLTVRDSGNVEGFNFEEFPMISEEELYDGNGVRNPDF